MKNISKWIKQTERPDPPGCLESAFCFSSDDSIGPWTGIKPWLAALIIVIILAASPIALAQDLIRNYTPAAWQADDVKWCRDVSPHNHIDDLIDAAKDTLFNVIVNFRRCVESEDSTDLENLTPISTVQLKCKYISSVLVSGVTTADIQDIVAMDGVAFVEEQQFYDTLLEVSLENIQVAHGSGFYGTNTVEDGWPAINGSGINILIMDTGVDNGVHSSLPNTRFIGGYDELAVSPGFGDPDDIHGHGTHVASIALGEAAGGYTPRGVAPGAGLIDVKCIPGFTNQIQHALEVIYDNRRNWNGTGERVNVINMSFGDVQDADGTESFNQLVDLAECMGIVVTAAAGNSKFNPNPPTVGFGTPAAATRAITVAGHNDGDSPDTTDDAIYVRSNQGPRTADGDQESVDELKPEVTAPAVSIVAAAHNSTNGTATKTGTSMAAPHVAGLAALLMHARPALVNNAASLKDLIISTAQGKGGASQPGTDPDWNNRWGWGHVNAFEAFATATQTDLTFPNHPPDPSWLSPDISTVPDPPTVGQPARVIAQIQNAGPNHATDARIHFGVHDFSNNTYAFYDIGTKIVDLSVGNTPVSIDWTPQSSGHMCLKVEIGYNPDTDYSNNKAQRNISVSRSPVYFRVQNTLTETPALIDFVPTFEYPQNGWQVQITPSEVTLAADDCPVDIEVRLIPPGNPVRADTQIVHVAAMIGDTEIGGVSVRHVCEEAVPTLTEWGLVVLVALVVLSAWVVLRKRKAVLSRQ